MKSMVQLTAAGLLAAALFALPGCGCGFDCNTGDDEDSGPAAFTLGFSDAFPEDAAEVVLKIDRITLRRPGGEDVVIDAFTIDDPPVVVENAASFTVNLLDFRGASQLDVITDRELETGAYSEIDIAIDTGAAVDGDVNASYVREAISGESKAIVISGDWRSPSSSSGTRI